jgi:hypothetical protein
LSGVKSVDSESISWLAMVSSRSLTPSAGPGSPSSSSCDTTSSAKFMVDITRASPTGRTATRYCFERMTTLAMPTLPESRMASSSSRYAFSPRVSGST